MKKKKAPSRSKIRKECKPVYNPPPYATDLHFPDYPKVFPCVCDPINLQLNVVEEKELTLEELKLKIKSLEKENRILKDQKNALIISNHEFLKNIDNDGVIV